MRRDLTTLTAGLVLTAIAVLLAVSENAISEVDTGEETGNSLFVTRTDSLIYKFFENQAVAMFKIQHKFRLYSLSVSPNEQYFAFIDIKEGEYHTVDSQRSGKYDVLPEIYLRIVNRNGELIHSLKHAQRYVWSPDGNRIAYITFDLTYADYQDRRPTGLYVFDITSGQLERIDKTPTELFWAPHNGRLYFTTRYALDRSVFEWNPESSKVVETSYKDIYFSPDGKYYLSLNKVEYKPVQLYDASSNEELFAIEVRELVFPPGVAAEAFPKDIGTLAGSSYLESLKPWVPSSDHLLLFVKEDVEKELAGTGPTRRVVSRVIKGAENYIFDVEKREVVRQFSGKPTEWISNGKVLVVERDGDFSFEQLSFGD